MNKNIFIDKQQDKTSEVIRMIAWVKLPCGTKEIKDIIEINRFGKTKDGMRRAKRFITGVLNGVKAEIWIESAQSLKHSAR